MREDDARKLDHATLEAMRIRAVRSVQAGENPEVVARWTGLETPKSRYGRPNGDHRQRGFPHQGPCIDAPITKRPRENPFLLPKAIPQIRRMKVNLTYGLINS